MEGTAILAEGNKIWLYSNGSTDIGNLKAAKKWLVAAFCPPPPPPPLIGYPGNGGAMECEDRQNWGEGRPILKALKQNRILGTTGVFEIVGNQCFIRVSFPSSCPSMQLHTFLPNTWFAPQSM